MNRNSLRKVPSVLIAGVMAVPIMCVLSNAFAVDFTVWRRLIEHRIPQLLWNSLALVIVVGIASLLLGSLLAFLVERTDVPLRHVMKPLLVAPLIIPCYVVAICYVNFFGIQGLGEKFLGSLGVPARLPNIYGFWGAALTFTVGCYPYVYAIVSASINKLDPTYSEAARCLGANRWQRWTQVNLPLLIPAFSAGTILVAFYVLSDFGVVSMLRYPTFVNTIYDQMSGRYDYSVATALSTVLMALTLGLFFCQEYLVKRGEFVSPKSKIKNRPLYALGMLKYPALAFVSGILVLGLIVPLGILIYWMVMSWNVSSEMTIWATALGGLMRSGLNSLFVSAIVATLAVGLALPIAYWTVRQPKSLSGKVVGWISQSGIALPGVLTALGLSLVFSKTAPKINFSVFALVMAFLIHFYAKALQMVQAGLNQVPRRLEEGAMLLGCSPLTAFWKVSRPLLKPALLTGWILVFLSSMRELPASLLLRPAGFDPLTVRIWIAASEGFYEQAAFPSLLLIVLSLPLVIVVSKAKDVTQTSD